MTASITSVHALRPDLVVLPVGAHRTSHMGSTRFRHLRTNTLRPAFTLAEIMIVVVISGVMVALEIPRIDTTKYRADAIAQIVRTTLQTAQRQAITRQHDMVVSF